MQKLCTQTAVKIVLWNKHIVSPIRLKWKERKWDRQSLPHSRGYCRGEDLSRLRSVRGIHRPQIRIWNMSAKILSMKGQHLPFKFFYTFAHLPKINGLFYMKGDAWLMTYSRCKRMQRNSNKDRFILYIWKSTFESRSKWLTFCPMLQRGTITLSYMNTITCVLNNVKVQYSCWGVVMWLLWCSGWLLGCSGGLLISSRQILEFWV